MAQLFVVEVGGYPPGAHTEIHDIRFAVGETIEDCIPQLKAGWWGGGRSFHLDAWGSLPWADGHRIVVADEAPDGAAEGLSLWFVHLGGYREGHFGELHHNVFVAAKDAPEAKRKGLALAPGWDSPHRDTQFAIEGLVAVNDAVPGKLWLVPQAEEIPFVFEARYRPIRG